MVFFYPSSWSDMIQLNVFKGGFDWVDNVFEWLTANLFIFSKEERKYYIFKYISICWGMT